MSAFVLLYMPCANTDTTNTFITNETNNATHASMKKYILASRTLLLSRLFTSRDYNASGTKKKRNKSGELVFGWPVKMGNFTLTNAECKYKLCGMITAPTIPTACISSFDPQSVHHGINIPFATSAALGSEMTYYGKIILVLKPEKYHF